MDRYIECKTQEQWDIILNWIKIKLKKDVDSFGFINNYNNYKEKSVIRIIRGKSWGFESKDYYKRNGITNFTTFEEFCKQEEINMKKTTQQELEELKAKVLELEAKIKEENVENLIAEAKRKYPKGTVFITAAGGGTRHLSDGNAVNWINPIYKDGIANNPGTGLFYANGKWAEIIKEESIEISGYKAEFNKKDKTVSFGCKKDITIEDLKAILIVMKLNEKFDEPFVISTYDVECEDNDLTVSKETIEKLINKLEE